jgi:protease PrsW
VVISPIYVAVAGALPALFAMWYFDRLDRKRPEPAGLRRLVALFGGLAVIPTLIIDAVLLGGMGDHQPSEATYLGAVFTSFIVAALIEEAMKVSVVYAVAWDRTAYDERLDAVVYGARAGLGFALVENVFYLLGEVELKGLVVTWLLRAVLAVPGHALWTTIACAGATRRRFDQRGIGAGGGYLLAVFLHGTYDCALFLAAPLAAHGKANIAYALLSVPILVMITSWWLVKRYARIALELDDADAAQRMGGRSSSTPTATAAPPQPGHAYPPPGYGYPPPGYYYPPHGYGYPPGYPWAGGWPHPRPTAPPPPGPTGGKPPDGSR